MSNICRISQLVIHLIIRPHNDGEAATNAPNIRACPGLKGTKDEWKNELREYLEHAESDGADVRQEASQKIRKDGSSHRCIECGKTKKRRDRMVTHVIYEHLGLKPWPCPLWCVRFRGSSWIYPYFSAARGATQVVMSCRTIYQRQWWFACGMLPRGPDAEMF